MPAVQAAMVWMAKDNICQGLDHIRWLSASCGPDFLCLPIFAAPVCALVQPWPVSQVSLAKARWFYHGPAATTWTVSCSDIVTTIITPQLSSETWSEVSWMSQLYGSPLLQCCYSATCLDMKPASGNTTIMSLDHQIRWTGNFNEDNYTVLGPNQTWQRINRSMADLRPDKL